MSSPPAAPDVRHQRLAMLLADGAFGKAESEAAMALRTHPRDGLLWKYLAQAQGRAGKDVLDALRHAVALLPGDIGALQDLGDACCQRGLLDEAVACYQRVLTQAPDAFGALMNLGAALHQRGIIDEAERLFRRALDVRPESAEAHFNLAQVWRGKGRFAEAAGLFRQAIRLRPAFWSAYEALGHLLARGVESDGREFPDLVAQHLVAGASAAGAGDVVGTTRHARALVATGDNLFAGQDFAPAEAVQRLALSLAPDLAEAHGSLGLVLFRLARCGEAEASFQEAFALRPDFPELHRRKAAVLNDMGWRDQASLQLFKWLGDDESWEQSLAAVLTQPIRLDGLDLTADEIPRLAALAVPPQIADEHAPDAATPIERPLKVVLIYPPPWRIGTAATDADDPFAPPGEERARVVEGGDFAVLPYGLLTLAAEVKRAGHEVEILNLALHDWRAVEARLRATAADIYGISAFTSNRRGMGAVARFLRAHRPGARIVAGGPFVSALPIETLHYYRDIDLAVIGEGELTFNEVLDRVRQGRPLTGIAGSAWRQDGKGCIGPARPRIRHLDELASPFDHFSSDIVMTSRGCPSNCSFCGSVTTWGKKLRFHSVAATVEIFRKALKRLPIPVLTVKDDTFAAHRQRALDICAAISEQGMKFVWSCDTRVDSLDDEVLRAMRLAGCQQISLGVESGSQAILDTIRKQCTPAAALKVTALARRYGIAVRYYMIVGNRGESLDTVRESIELARAARPASSMFFVLSFFPGTEEWDLLRRQHGLSTDLFFRNDFRELSLAHGRHDAWERAMLGIERAARDARPAFTVEERREVAERLPQLPSAFTDLASACLQAGHLDDADRALDQAEALGYPVPVLIDNQRACIAIARGDAARALRHLDSALNRLEHPLLRINRYLVTHWMNSPAAFRVQPPPMHDSALPFDFLTDAG